MSFVEDVDEAIEYISTKRDQTEKNMISHRQKLRKVEHRGRGGRAATRARESKEMLLKAKTLP